MTGVACEKRHTDRKTWIIHSMPLQTGKKKSTGQHLKLITICISPEIQMRSQRFALCNLYRKETWCRTTEVLWWHLLQGSLWERPVPWLWGLNVPWWIQVRDYVIRLQSSGNIVIFQHILYLTNWHALWIASWIIVFHMLLSKNQSVTVQFKVWRWICPRKIPRCWGL